MPRHGVFCDVRHLEPTGDDLRPSKVANQTRWFPFQELNICRHVSLQDAPQCRLRFCVNHEFSYRASPTR